MDFGGTKKDVLPDLVGSGRDGGGCAVRTGGGGAECAEVTCLPALSSVVLRVPIEAVPIAIQRMALLGVKAGHSPSRRHFG